MHVIVGTAGHIDHGKTALVKALTGTDADRLPEEKRRGITVDLGFAAMTAGETQFDFVDVPGHERFVKNMLAGASGMDLVMLVVAADEGVMPQTREHFDICRLLGMNAGIVVLTKTDLADADVLELARLDVSELVAGTFLDDAPIIAVSSRTGEGIDELKVELSRIAAGIPARGDDLVTRLPIDRSFSVKGFGAVVTGTLASGKLGEGDELALHPGNERVRVRGLQTHGEAAATVNAGQRVAVNLGGIDHHDVSRGMVLTEPDVLTPTQIVDAEIEVPPAAAKPLRSRQRIRFHIGTVEALARVQVLDDAGEIAQGAKGPVQIRLEVPVTTVPGERFIIRSYSPQATIGGGVVIDTFAVRHRRKDLGRVRDHLIERLAALGDQRQTVGLVVSSAGPVGMSMSDLQQHTGLKKELIKSAVDELIADKTIVEAGSRYITSGAFERLSAATLDTIADFHRREPIVKGITRESLTAKIFVHLPPEIFTAVAAKLAASDKIVAERDTIRLASHSAELSPAECELSDKILDRYNTAGLEVPKLGEALAEAVAGTAFDPQDARRLFQLALDSGKIVKVTDEFYFSRSAIDELTETLRQFAAATADRLIDVPTFKDIAGISRKYAIPLLEYFDRERVTRRAGDKRLVL